MASVHRQCSTPHLYPETPFDPELLQKYGIINQIEMDAVESLIRSAFGYGNEALRNGLLTMFRGMEQAVKVYMEMKNETVMLHEGILSMKKETLDMKKQLNAAENVMRQKIEEQCQHTNTNYETAMVELERTDARIQEQNMALEQSAIEQRRMQSKIQELESSNASMHEMIENIKKEVEQLKEECVVKEQHCATTLAELHAREQQHQQLTSLPGAPFYDAITQTTMACPVLQSNGQLVPLKTVITQWAAASSPHDGYMYRTYVCPVMLLQTTLASAATQERIRSIARSAGIDTTPPLVFSYHSDTNQETVFEFEDQLAIITKIYAMHTMEIDQCTEHAMVQHNTMVIELNAAFALVNTHVFINLRPNPHPSCGTGPRNAYQMRRREAGHQGQI